MILNWPSIKIENWEFEWDFEFLTFFQLQSPDQKNKSEKLSEWLNLASEIGSFVRLLKHMSQFRDLVFRFDSEWLVSFFSKFWYIDKILCQSCERRVANLGTYKIFKMKGIYSRSKVVIFWSKYLQPSLFSPLFFYRMHWSAVCIFVYWYT